MTIEELRSRLTLPVIAAPMFLVSGPDLVIACCKAGVMGSFPTANARTEEECAAWLERIDAELASVPGAAPYAVNIVVRGAGTPRFEADLALLEKHRPAVVITSVGSPAAVVPRVKAYGGLVFHDVATLRHAEKAIEAGVDGLILLTAGAGGHTGTANPFAFVPQVRRIFGGAILLAGGIGEGRGVRATEILGADFAYMGTRFAATQESLASDAYRDLLVSQQMADVVTTDRISGLSATFLRGSIAAVGLNPDALPPVAERFRSGLPDDIKAWRDVWSGGHGVGLIDDIPSVADLVARLAEEYRAAGQGDAA